MNPFKKVDMDTLFRVYKDLKRGSVRELKLLFPEKNRKYINENEIKMWIGHVRDAISK